MSFEEHAKQVLEKLKTKNKNYDPYYDTEQFKHLDDWDKHALTVMGKINKNQRKIAEQNKYKAMDEYYKKLTQKTSTNTENEFSKNKVGNIVDKSKPSYLTAVKKGFDIGTSQFQVAFDNFMRKLYEVTSPGDNSGDLKGITEYIKKNEEIIKSQNEELAKMPKSHQIIGQISAGVSQNLPSMLAGAAIGLYVPTNISNANKLKNLVTKAAQMSPFFFTSFGSYAREAENEGANPKQQMLYGLTGATIETLTEMPIMTKWLDAMSGKAVKGLIKSNSSSIVKRLGITGLNYFADALGEGFQEAITEPMTKTAKKVIYNPNITKKEIFNMNDVKESGIVGFGMGLVLGAFGLPSQFKATEIAQNIVNENRLPTHDEIEQIAADIEEYYTLQGKKFKVRTKSFNEALKKYDEALKVIYNTYGTYKLNPEEISIIKEKTGIDIDNILGELSESEKFVNIKDLNEKLRWAYITGYKEKRPLKLSRTNQINIKPIEKYEPKGIDKVIELEDTTNQENEENIKSEISKYITPKQNEVLENLKLEEQYSEGNFLIDDIQYKEDGTIDVKYLNKDNRYKIIKIYPSGDTKSIDIETANKIDEVDNKLKELNNKFNNLQIQREQGEDVTDELIETIKEINKTKEEKLKLKRRLEGLGFKFRFKEKAPNKNEIIVKNAGDSALNNEDAINIVNDIQTNKDETNKLENNELNTGENQRQDENKPEKNNDQISDSGSNVDIVENNAVKETDNNIQTTNDENDNKAKKYKITLAIKELRGGPKTYDFKEELKKRGYKWLTDGIGSYWAKEMTYDEAKKEIDYIRSQGFAVSFYKLDKNFLDYIRRGDLQEEERKLFEELIQYNLYYGKSVKKLSKTIDLPPSKMTSKKSLDLGDLKKLIYNEFGLLIKKAKLKGAYGIYKTHDEIARTLFENDIMVSLHELGHHIFKHEKIDLEKFKDELTNVDKLIPVDMYKEEEKLEERFANFLMYYITDKEGIKKLVPNFYEYFKENISKDTKKSLQKLQNEIHKFVNLPPHIQVEKTISFRESQKQEKVEMPLKIKKRMQWIDETAPIHFVKQVAEEIKGKALESFEDFAKKYSLFKGGFEGKVMAFIFKGAYNLKREFIGEGLADILKEVKSLGDEAYKHFATYLVARRALDYENKDLRLPLQNFKTYKDAKEYLEKKYPKFPEFFERVKKWEDNLINLAKESGLLEEDLIEEMRKENPNHVPLYRIHEKRSGNKLIYELEGGGEQIIDPIENYFYEAYKFIKRVEENEALKVLYNALKNIEGLGEFLEIVNEKIDDNIEIDDTNRLLKVYFDGEAKYIRVNNQELWNMFKKSDIITNSIIAKYLAPFTRILKAGVVTNPAYIVRQLAKDTTGALIASKSIENPKDFLKFIKYWIKGLKSSIKKDDLYWEYILAGGGVEKFQVNSRRQVQRLIDEALDNNFIDLLKRVFIEFDISTKEKRKRNIYNIKAATVDYLFNLIENTFRFKNVDYAARLAEYQLAKEKLQDKEEAAYRGRKISLDFTLTGTYAKQLNEFIPFFASSIKALDRFYESFKKEPVLTTIKGLFFVTAPALILYFMYDDDEDYRSLSNYRKVFFLNFKMDNGKFLSIPIAQDYAYIFAAPVLAGLEYIRRHDKYSFDLIKDNFITAYGINFGIEPFETILELKTNKKWSGGTIEDYSEQKLSPRERYDEKTSNIAKFIGDKLNLSPKKIDYALEKGLGFYGKAIQNLSSINKIDLKDIDLSSAYLTRSFISNPRNYPKELSDFYEEYKKLERKYNDSKIKGKELSKEEKKRFLELKLYFNQISKAKEMITKIKRSKLDEEIKEEKIKKLKEIIGQYAKQAVRPK